MARRSQRADSHQRARYGKLTDYTETIKQRRALIVTDDYIVIADWMKGTSAHTFESLLHMKGFQGLEAPEKKHLRHDGQWDANPVGSAQFVADCNWYEVAAPAVSKFQVRFGPGEDNEGSRSLGNEDGVLKTDVHSLWPPKQEIMVAAAPEFLPVEKRLFYTVRGDGKVLTEGKFGAWILGAADIDVPLDGVKQLELETRMELSKKPTLFWANARVVLMDGSERTLAELGAPVSDPARTDALRKRGGPETGAPARVRFENISQPKTAGKDYFGGPIKIAGNEYTSATPAQPTKDGVNGLVRVDLSGVNAVRFKATLGGDYPLGDETQRRKVFAVRAPDGNQARFLTVIEPYENQPMVKSAVATSADALRVELADGRVQEISLKNFDGSGKDIEVNLVESRSGQVVRRERAGGN